MPDLEGCVLCLEARQLVEMKLMSKLGLDRVILKDAFNDWVEAYNFIRARVYEKTLGKRRPIINRIIKKYKPSGSCQAAF